ncbi:glycosyltransferase family 2 protein [Escherichia coli]|nr:glycosyltransferase family 2 protein [Escherichia coli]EJJ0982980.1 glycosyltransferase [Escherichia coli]HAZ7271952.1 glycosyltransferase family 2 protein [Escherichia coli]
MQIKNNINDLTIAISTYGERIVNAKKIALEFSRNGFRVDIIHQADNPDIIEEEIIDNKQIRYFYQNSKGVTKSRNYAIDVCTTKYIWFMDDDITFDYDNIHQLYGVLKKINCDNVSVCLTRIKDENGQPRKKYPQSGKIYNKRKIISVGTIEIIADATFLKRNDIKFDENFGAGAAYPVGDEALFLNDVLDSNGSIYHFDLYFLFHPKDSSGIYRSKLHFYSKGIVFRRLYGVIGLFYILYLILFRFNFFKEVSSLYLLKGYMVGGRR